jgi:hypothetical protein
MAHYRSRASTRLALVWQRMPQADRRVVCLLGGLVQGAELAPVQNFSEQQLQCIAKGMRAIVSLAGECSFALSYSREQPGATAKV